MKELTTVKQLLHEYYEDNETPLKLANKMELNLGELSHFLEKYSPFLMLVMTDGLRRCITNHSFIKSTPADALYRGRDILAEAIDQYQEEFLRDDASEDV